MLSHLPLLLLRALLGGGAVVAFSLIGETVRPKSFAGVFAAAPSVAVASLGVAVLSKGPDDARLLALGMIAGACAMLACVVAAIDTVRRFRALRGAIAALLVWGAVAGTLYGVTLR